MIVDNLPAGSIGFVLFPAEHEGARETGLLFLPETVLSPLPAIPQVAFRPASYPLRGAFFYQVDNKFMAMRFDPTVNLGHVLTFVGFMVAGFGAYGVMDKRVAIVEQGLVNQAAVDKRQDEDRADMKRTNREDFKEINSKLDRLLIASQQPRNGR